MMVELFVGAFLLWESLEDIKTQTLEARILIGFGVLAVILEIFYVKANWTEVLAGAALGILALMMAWLSKESIGYGDGVVMLIMGICCGLNIMLETFLLAIMILAVVSMVMMIKKGVILNLRIPFIPCLFVGYIGGLLL